MFEALPVNRDIFLGASSCMSFDVGRRDFLAHRRLVLLYILRLLQSSLGHLRRHVLLDGSPFMLS